MLCYFSAILNKLSIKKKKAAEIEHYQKDGGGKAPLRIDTRRIDGNLNASDVCFKE